MRHHVLFSGLLGLGLLFSGALPAHADHFAVDIEVKSSAGTKTARAEKAAPGEKAKPRVVVKAKPGETLTVKWTLTNVAAQEFPDVLAHCFVVQEKALGQSEVPKLDKDVVYESALTMDFKPKDKASGQMTLRVMKPGYYLLRVETMGAEGLNPHDHEHFAAMDLDIH